MSNESSMVVGVVVEAHRGGIFAVEFTLGTVRRRVLAKICGRMVLRHATVIAGDRVELELSNDPSRGRIARRLSGNSND